MKRGESGVNALLGIDKPVALAAGDMDENGDVDIFDLSLMKRALLKH